jgi:hypothetical protein
MSSEGQPPPSDSRHRDGGGLPHHPKTTLGARLLALVSAVRDGDEAMVEESILRLSHTRRLFAPLAFMAGGLVMLFDGVKLLFSNWKLTLVQVLPAVWIWVATYDLKAHALHGKSFHVLRGPILIPLVLVVVAITTASFFLNAVFGFAVVQSGPPRVRPAFRRARTHRWPILISGAIVGLALAFSTLVVTRWGRPWFGISLSIVIGVMMFSYVAVPARLIGVKPKASRRDKLTSSAASGALSLVASTPPYLLGRIGILMLGSHILFIPGIIILTLGVTLQAGATGAVRTIKMSVNLIGADHSSALAAAEPLPTDKQSS